jgi:hypothetical protein
MGITEPGKSKHPLLKVLIFLIMSILLVVLLVLVRLRQDQEPWKTYQEAYRTTQAHKLRTSLQGTLPEAELKARVAAVSHSPLRVKELRPMITGKVERCLTCHDGLEEIDASHPVEAFGCVVCHGGEGLGVTAEIAHQGLIGGRNPADLSVADQTCGRPGGQCHAERNLPAQNSVARVRSGIMATMSGVIASLRYSWGAQASDEARYAAVGVKKARPKPGSLAELLTIPQMAPAAGNNPVDPLGQKLAFSGEPADDHWRKLCATCHLWNKKESGPSAHSSGCAACHALYNTTATYEGSDPTIPRDQPGYPRLHRLTTAIPVDQCLRCHNRSGRLGLSYTGLDEADGYGTPYRKGRPNLSALSGDRDVRHLVPDIHFERGLICIDCHSGKEVMGDGNIYSHMRHQVEIRCSDCHGSFGQPPQTKILTSDDEEAVWRAKALRLPDPQGLEVGLTQRGTAILNLRKENGHMILRSKLDQKDHPCPTISDLTDKYHRIAGHDVDRLECSACHSRWAPQCYGCHDYRRRGEAAMDSMRGVKTEGLWQETRDYYRFDQPTLGINSRSRVSVVMPGCQVVFTELEPDGKVVAGSDKKVFMGPGIGHGIVWTPISPHTTRSEVRSCQECHAGPKTLGIGQGLFQAGERWAENTFIPLLQPEINPLGFAWESLVDPQGQPLAASTHVGARPFNAEELQRLLRVAPCLPCHGRYDDPIWANPAAAFEKAKLPAHQQKVSRRLARTE